MKEAQEFVRKSLAEAKEMLIEGSEVNEWIENVYDEYNFINILIDIANGHLNDLHLTASLIKEKYACSIMIGNIANPRIIEDSFNLYGDIIDYYRVGIGGGSRCHTSSKTAIHYPIPIHLQSAAKFLGHSLGSFPATEQQSKRILTLPINQLLTHDQIGDVAVAINKFFHTSLKSSDQ